MRRVHGDELRTLFGGVPENRRGALCCKIWLVCNARKPITQWTTGHGVEWHGLVEQRVRRDPKQAGCPAWVKANPDDGRAGSKIGDEGFGPGSHDYWSVVIDENNVNASIRSTRWE
jgi:hypothetical protein